MNKLQQLIKNPNCRFKTTTEMVNDYGQNYMDLIMNMETLDVLTIMSLFGGKKLYPQLVLRDSWKIENVFLYGPTAIPVHIDMLTTHAYPKWSSRADILKPGMLVTVEYGIPIKEHTVPSCFCNAPGTTVRILKVVKPTTYFRTSIIWGGMVDKYHVATELLKPATDQSKGEVEVKYNHLFKNCKVVAFEISWHLRKATEVERKFYYSQFHTSEISCSPKSDKGHLGFVDGRE